MIRGRNCFFDADSLCPDLDFDDGHRRIILLRVGTFLHFFQELVNHFHRRRGTQFFQLFTKLLISKGQKSIACGKEDVSGFQRVGILGSIDLRNFEAIECGEKRVTFRVGLYVRGTHLTGSDFFRKDGPHRMVGIQADELSFSP